MKNRSEIVPKARKTALCIQIDKDSVFGVPFSTKKLIFCRFVGSRWIPGGLPGHLGYLPEAFNFIVHFQFRLNTGLDRPPGGPREAPSVPKAPPGHDFGSILDRFFGSPGVLLGPKNRLIFPVIPLIPMIPSHETRHEKSYGNLLEFSQRSLGNCQ